MTPNQGEPEFNQARAELFEALGHPIRIRILQTLEREPMGFAELKKAVGIESSGHLTFHLGKLEGLLKVGQDGGYSLTDEGREALRVISATRDEGEGGIKLRAPRMAARNVAIVALIIGLLLTTSIVIYQQQQIGALNRSIASQQVGSVVINGTRYSYLDIPMQSLNLPTIIRFNGVTFNLTAPSLSGAVSFVVVSNAQQGGTFLQANQTGQPVTVRIFPLGANVQVKFADGQQESYSTANQLRNQTGVVYVNLQPSNPWFTRHMNPQAGVYWNSTADSVELLVSMGA